MADTLTVKYAGSFEYNAANSFSRLALAEGQATYRNDTLRFDYYLKDHLGNIRLVFDEKGKVLQETDYYPFGLEIDRNNPVQTPASRNGVNRYNFLGKETQVATGYIDLSRRFYDSSTGRFMQVDPVTEGQEDQSTYQYGWNNPILKSDPNGTYPDGGDDGFLIARLVATAFFDTKYAIINTTARVFGSDIRAGYKVEDGQQVFETQISRQAVDNSLGGQVKEAVNAVADVALVATAGTSPANPGNLMVKTSESQVVKAGKEGVEGVITGYTRHGLNQSIGRDGGRGVKAAEMVDAVKNPKKVTTQNNGGIKYDGKGAKVVVNSDGKIISTFGKARGEAIYSNGKGNNALNRAKELGLEYDPKKIR